MPRTTSNSSDFIRHSAIAPPIERYLEKWYREHRNFDGLPKPSQIYTQYEHLLSADQKAKDSNWKGKCRWFITRTKNKILQQRGKNTKLFNQILYVINPFYLYLGFEDQSDKSFDSDTGFAEMNRLDVNPSELIRRRTRCELDAANSDSDLFVINPEVFTTSQKKIALFSLDIDTTAKKCRVEIADDGRSATCTIYPPDFIYKPSNVLARKVDRGNVLYESIKNWTAEHKKHSEDTIAYTYHLDLPFKAKRTTVKDYFHNTSGQNIIIRRYKKDAMEMTDFYKSVLLIFEEDSVSNYLVSKKPVEKTFSYDFGDSD